MKRCLADRVSKVCFKSNVTFFADFENFHRKVGDKEMIFSMSKVHIMAEVLVWFLWKNWGIWMRKKLDKKTGGQEIIKK